MSEYTHYYCVRSSDTHAVKSVLSQHKILSVVARGDEYPGEPEWQDIPAEKRWVVLSVYRAMHSTADGKYFFDEPWDILPQLFPSVVELWVDEIDLKEASWTVKIAKNGKTIMIWESREREECSEVDLEKISIFFDSPRVVFKNYLASGCSYDFCRAVGLPFHHLVAEAGFPSFLIEKMAQHGFSLFPEELDKL